jgi:hypothetical protein
MEKDLVLFAWTGGDGAARLEPIQHLPAEPLPFVV